ncbi:MAG: SH3 domain-containing protein, partial [Mariprofundaceae bacterium]|nr:SH3 domain-containing protein [Mariprofundaceae bacterium]
IKPALPEIDFSVVKSKNTFQLGGSLDFNGYKIVVTNVGAAVNVPPGQIIVTDTVPAGLSLQVLPTADWLCTPPAISGPGTITCEWVGTGTIAPNQQLPEIVFRAFSFTAEPVENCASLYVDDGLGQTDVNLSNNGPSCVDFPSDLSVTKTLLNGPLSVGDVAKFKIVGNYSATSWLLPQTSAPLTIIDDLPAGFVFSGVASSSSSNWSCSASGLQVTCTYIGGGGIVMPGDLPELIIEATATTAGLFENCASIFIVNSGPDANPLNDHSCPTFEVSKTEARIDFSIEKSFEFNPGISSEFIIQVNNEGDTLSAPATISVEELLPAGMMAQFSAASSANWSCPTGLITGSANISCEWQGPFPVGPGLMPAIRFESILTAATPVRNCARVVISGGQSDLALGNNGPSCPEAYADIGIIKKPQFTGVLNIGDQANFALHINVSSDFQILNQPPNLLTINDTLPAGLTFAGIVPNPQWTCTATGQQVHCELTGAGSTIGGNGIGLNGNFSNPLIIKTIVTGPVNDQNCAVISKPGSGADSVPGNNESCVDVDAKDKTVKADLGVKKLLISKSPLFVGDIAVFKLLATNFSNVLISTSGSTQLLVTDTLPSGFEFVSATTSPPWNCTGGGRNVSCLWVGPPSTVIPGPLAPIIVKAVVKDATGRRNCPRISISGQYVDVNSGNNGTCLDVDVRPKPKSKVDLGIKKELLAKGPLTPGNTVKFKLYIDNHGTSVATPPAFQIKVRDTLPPGFIFLGASTNGQWACLNASAPGQIDCGWTGGQTIPSGPMGWIVISAKVPKGPAKLRQCAKVKITGQTDVHPEDNRVCIPVLITTKASGGNTGGSSDTFTPTIGQFACVSGLRNAASSLNMRTAPSGSAPVIQKLPMGTALVILNRKGKWSQIQVVKNGGGSAIGWVASQFTKEVKSAGQCKIPDTGATTGGNTSTGTGSTGGNHLAATAFLCVAGLPKGDNFLNLREQPKASSKLISKLPSGSVLLLTAKRGGWNRVQMFDNGSKGAQGWVSGKYTKEVRNPETCRKFIVSPDNPRVKAPVKPAKGPLIGPVKIPVIPLGNPVKPSILPGIPEK